MGGDGALLDVVAKSRLRWYVASEFSLCPRLRLPSRQRCRQQDAPPLFRSTLLYRPPYTAVRASGDEQVFFNWRMACGNGAMEGRGDVLDTSSHSESTERALTLSFYVGSMGRRMVVVSCPASPSPIGDFFRQGSNYRAGTVGRDGADGREGWIVCVITVKKIRLLN